MITACETCGKEFYIRPSYPGRGRGRFCSRDCYFGSVRLYEICLVEGCKNKVRSPGCPYCEKHYYRLRRNGAMGLKQPAAKRGHSHGYVMVYAPNHPLVQTHSGNYEYEHRVVYYAAHGAGPFDCHWCGKIVAWDSMHVDHLNHEKDDNRIENLVASCPLCNQERERENTNQVIKEKKSTWLEYGGERKTIKEWASQLGIAPESLHCRIKNGWTLERALTEPRGKTGPVAQRG